MVNEQIRMTNDSRNVKSLKRSNGTRNLSILSEAKNL